MRVSGPAKRPAAATIALPTRAAGLLSAYVTDDSDELPDESTIAPYQVTFSITQQSGVTAIMNQSSDPAYSLATHERLSLNNVEVTVEEPDA